MDFFSRLQRPNFEINCVESLEFKQKKKFKKKNRKFAETIIKIALTQKNVYFLCLESSHFETKWRIFQLTKQGSSGYFFLQKVVVDISQNCDLYYVYKLVCIFYESGRLYYVPKKQECNLIKKMGMLRDLRTLPTSMKV